MLRAPTRPPRAIGKYLLFDELASGGMATIYLGRLESAAPPHRCLAIKRMHPQFSREPDFVAMFLDEARLAARVHHPNVVPTIDVERMAGEIVHVMPYVHGESLNHLMREAKARGEAVPARIASAILVGALEGLHAAHEAVGDDGATLQIVHRDVSPQNILVGADGMARVLDFGVAKAAGRLHSTRGSEVKGKFAYMAPEQVQRQTVDRRTDVWAAAVVLWELVTGERLFAADTPAGSVQMILGTTPRRTVELRPDLPADLDAVVAQGLAKDPEARFASARALASALGSCVPVASQEEVGAWVRRLAEHELYVRAARVEVVESAGMPGPRVAEERPLATTEPTAPGRGRAGGGSTATAPAAPEDEAIVLPRRGSLGLRAAVAGAVVGVVAVAIVLVSQRGSTAAEPEPSVSGPRPTESRAAPATTPAATVTPAEATQAASTSPAASATAVASVAPTTTATAGPRTAPPATPRTTAATSRPSAAAKPNCSQPFRFDPDGTKIPKPECL